MQFSLWVYMSMMQVVNITRAWRGWLLTLSQYKLRPNKWNSQEQTKRGDTLWNESPKLVHRFKFPLGELYKFLKEIHHNLLKKTNPTSLRRCPGHQRPPMAAADKFASAPAAELVPVRAVPLTCLRCKAASGEVTFHPGVDSTTQLMKSRIWPVDTLIQIQENYLLKNMYLKTSVFILFRVLLILGSLEVEKL